MSGLVALVVATSTAAAGVAVEAASPSRPAAFGSSVRFGTGVGLFDDDGLRAVLTPRFALGYAFAPEWRFEASWSLAMSYAPEGTFAIRGEDRERRDDVPRTGNPLALLRYAALRAPSGFSVDVGAGFAFPMASIPKPTPASGPDFERTPHTEATYRRALASSGFRAPWTFAWNTATALATSAVRQVRGPVILDADVTAGLLIPAGRLRRDVGGVLAVGAYAGVEVDVVELGMRADLTWVSPQRDDFDGRLQIGGAQLALAPEVRADLFGPLFLEAAFVVTAGSEVEPAFERFLWGLQLDVGARL